MADVVQELVVAIGLDASGLSGLGKAVDSVGSAVGDASSKVNAAAKNVAGSLAKAGEAGKEAAEKLKNSWGGIAPILENLKGGFMGLVGALAGAGAASKLFSNYLDQGDKLQNLSRQLGINAKEIDAWSKANEAAGGSAEAFQSAMKSFYEKTGRPATEFLKFGERIEGMSKRQAQAYLAAQGVAQDAIPVFLNGQKAAEELVAKYRKTAFTAQDARNASNFKTAWMDFRIAVQGVGNTFLRHLVPAMTKVVQAFEAILSHITENIQFFTILGGVIAAVFALKNLEAIKAAALAVKAFGLSVKGALLPLTAIAAAIVAAAMAFDDLATFAQGGDSIFGRVLENIGMTSEEIEGMRETLKSLGGAFGKLMDAVKPLISGVIDIAMKGIAVAIVPLISLLAALAAGFTKIVQFAGHMKDAIVDAFKAVAEYLAPLQNTFGKLMGGVKSIFGFGGGDGDTAPREAQSAMELKSRGSGSNINTNSTINVTNNIQTRDDPSAISGAVGESVQASAGRANDLTAQTMRGVALK